MKMLFVDNQIMIVVDLAYLAVFVVGCAITALGIRLSNWRIKLSLYESLGLSHSNKAYYVGAVAILALTLMLPDMAFAQGSFMQQWLQFTTGRVATTVATAAIVLIGGVMVAQRHSAASIFITCAGIWIMLNAGNIEGWIGT